MYDMFSIGQQKLNGLWPGVNHVYKPWCTCVLCWKVTTVYLFPGYKIVETAEDLAALKAEVQACEYLSFDYETYTLTNDWWLEAFKKKVPFDMRNTHIASAQFTTKVGTGWYLPVCNKDSRNWHDSVVFEVLDLKPPAAELVIQNATYEAKVSMNCGPKPGYAGRNWYELPGPIVDTMCEAFTINELQQVGLKVLTKNKLGKRQIDFGELLKGCNADDMTGVSARQCLVYGCCDTDWSLELHLQQKAELQRRNLWNYMRYDFEMTPVISDMAYSGVRLSEVELEQQTLENFADMVKATEEVMRLAGRGCARGIKEFYEMDPAVRLHMVRSDTSVSDFCGADVDIGSPAQVAKLLYNDMRLPVTVLTDAAEAGKVVRDPVSNPAKGASTANEALVNIRDSHPIGAALMRFREYDQLNKMFYKPWHNHMHPETGCLHGEPRLTTNDDTGLSTGRMSYSDPNLQQIPKRGEKVRVRRIIIPDLGHDEIGSCDLSQVELRILAFFSRDPVLMDAYITGKDIHTVMASKIFGVPFDGVTKAMRFVGKTLNFAIIYGSSPETVMRIVNADAKKYGVDMPSIDLPTAQGYVATYFQALPGVASFIRSQHQFARQNGYVLTMLGRRFHLPDARSAKSYFRSKAERKSVNTPIQGSAGEILKRAATRIYKDREFTRMQRHGLAALKIMIHDELVFSYRSEIRLELSGLVREYMQDPPNGFDIPLEAGWAYGPNFADLKEL